MNSQLPVDTQLDAFEEKVTKLVENLNAARQRILDLEKEKTVLEREKADQAEAFSKLQNQMKQLEKKATNSPKGFSKSTNFAKIVRNNRNEAETTAELKQQLTAYIDELDRCIAYLSNLS
jgi:predicted nuclease with TOPRIM domain